MMKYGASNSYNLRDKDSNLDLWGQNPPSCR